MDPIQIKLTINQEDLNAIYFSDGKGSLFTAAFVKKPMRIALGLFILTAISIAAAIYAPPSVEPGIFIIAIFVAGLFAIAFLFNAITRYYKWRRPIDTYIAEQSRIHTASLSLNEEAFELVQDGAIILEKWEGMKNAIIEKDYLSITTPRTVYLFMAKSMRMDEFRSLSELVRSKMKS